MLMNMKTITVIAVYLTMLLGFTSALFCQNTFEYRIKDSLTDEVINNAIELIDGSYILVCNQMNPLPSWKVHMIRLSKSGKQLGSTDFNFQGQSSGFIDILQINPNEFLLAGYTIDLNKYKIWMYSMDSLFNEISSKVVGLDTCSLFTLNLIPDGNNFIVHGTLKYPSWMEYAFIYKFSSTLDSLQFKIFTDHPVMFQPSLLRKVDNSGYYFFLTGYRSVGSGYNEAILNLDNKFSISHINGVPDLIAEYPNSKWVSTNNYFLTGRKDDLIDPNNRCIAVLVMDTNYSLKHELVIGDHDTIEWPGMRKNLDYIDTNSIYVSGTHNFCQWEFCDVKSWFSLSNIDSLLNVRWQKFYGGTANYTLWGLTATHDGGCLLYGTLYDPETQNNERDVYVIKVNQDGLVGGIDNKTNLLVHDAIVYPNPGSDHLIVESGPQISGAEFRMTTIEGKQMMSKSLYERKTIVETKFLPSGIYIWQIIFQKRLVESGKWIKE